MRNPNYCHIIIPLTHPLFPVNLSVSVWSSENCDWTLSPKTALICLDPLVLLFVFCKEMESNQSQRSSRFLNTLKSFSLSPLDSSRYADGGWDEVGFLLRCLWEPESCQQPWDVTLSKTKVEACLCLYNLCMHFCVYCIDGYSMCNVCACICESQCAYECLVAGLRVYSVL